MVSRKTGRRIVTLAVAVYAAASADRPIRAMDFAPPRPPADIPSAANGASAANGMGAASNLVARDPRSGARLVWGGPVPPAPVPGGAPAHVPSASAMPAAPEPAYAPAAAIEPAAAAISVPEARGPGEYGRTYPVQDATIEGTASGPAALDLREEASLAPLSAPRVIDDGGAGLSDYGAAPDSGFDPWEGLTDPEIAEPEPEPAPAPTKRRPVPSWASLGGDRPMAPANRPPRGALERETPDGYRPMPKSEAMCRRELRKLGVQFTDASSVSSGRSCGIDDPVRVTVAVKGIAMSPAATLNCGTALRVARWLKDDVKPAARWKLWKQPTALINLSSYRCSRIAGSRTISEHAGGNALDVGGFRFADGSVVKVEPKGAFAWREKPFQAAVRKASCRHFGTVLGPGYNRAHADHLHLDSKARLRPVCK